MNEQQRSLHRIPKPLIILLVILLSLQIALHYQLPPPRLQFQKLTSPPKIELLRVFSLGDPIVSAKILMLWLQAFDNQSGQFFSYKQLNYTALQQWMEQILLLDPQTQYPLLAASHLYSTVKEPLKQKQMLEFVYNQFFIDPGRRWPWLAHAIIVAKHRLNDLPLALKYAQAIATHTTDDMPGWAREMQIFILEDMGELEQARLIIGGMLTSGKVTDLNEIKFLNDKLRHLEEKSQRSTY
jgi:hypothetical protein